MKKILLIFLVLFCSFNNHSHLDEEALNHYFKLLDTYPKLKREGELNNHKNGSYEIIYDYEKILTITEELFERHYNKAILQGLSSDKAQTQAKSYCKIGVIAEDPFWIWVRDLVISPSGYRHTYNRLIWKCDLDRTGGVAVLPIIKESGAIKLVLQLAFRHATQSFEWEIPRGGSLKDETMEETAKREVLEETGYMLKSLQYLGEITPDSGLTASITPIYLGIVARKIDATPEETEAIEKNYLFTLDEVENGLVAGFIEINHNGKMLKVPLRDPFLAYAILLAKKVNGF